METDRPFKNVPLDELPSGGRHPRSQRVLDEVRQRSALPETGLRLSEAIVKMNQCVLDTDAAGRPEASLVDTWNALMGALSAPRSARPEFYCAAGGCVEQCVNCADEQPASIPQVRSTTGAWVEVEKAKADAYEAAARIVEEMSYPPEGQERWHGTDNEWAAIKLEDAAKAIRERKAKVCHVTQAAVTVSATGRGTDG